MTSSVTQLIRHPTHHHLWPTTFNQLQQKLKLKKTHSRRRSRTLPLGHPASETPKTNFSKSSLKPITNSLLWLVKTKSPMCLTRLHSSLHWLTQRLVKVRSKLCIQRRSKSSSTHTADLLGYRKRQARLTPMLSTVESRALSCLQKTLWHSWALRKPCHQLCEH